MSFNISKHGICKMFLQMHWVPWRIFGPCFSNSWAISQCWLYHAPCAIF